MAGLFGMELHPNEDMEAVLSRIGVETVLEEMAHKTTLAEFNSSEGRLI